MINWPNKSQIYNYYVECNRGKRHHVITLERAGDVMRRQAIDEALAKATTPDEIKTINIEIYQKWKKDLDFDLHC